MALTNNYSLRLGRRTSRAKLEADRATKDRDLSYVIRKAIDEYIERHQGDPEVLCSLGHHEPVVRLERRPGARQVQPTTWQEGEPMKDHHRQVRRHHLSRSQRLHRSHRPRHRRQGRPQPPQAQGPDQGDRQGQAQEGRSRARSRYRDQRQLHGRERRPRLARQRSPRVCPRKTINDYKSLAESNLIPLIGACKLKELTADDVDDWLEGRRDHLTTRTPPSDPLDPETVHPPRSGPRQGRPQCRRPGRHPRRQEGRTPEQGHEPRPGHDRLGAREG